MAYDNTTTNSAPLAAPLDQLGFTSRHGDGRINLWSPAAVGGDYEAQCRAGREFAAEAIEHIRDSGNVPALAGIARAIAESGTFGGVEVGFFTAVSEQLAR